MLDKIKEMQAQGIPDNEIARQLVDSGYAPREVQEAISQSKIKAAVAEPEMQESLMSQETGEEIQPNPYPQFQPQQQDSYPPEQVGQQGQYQDQYPQYAGYQEAAPAFSSETISEIASQIVDEKINKISKKLSEFDDFKSITQAKIENLNERLVKIERILSDLNSAIIQRTGQYLEDVKNIKTEVGMMQDSMSKLVPSVVDSLKKIAGR